MKSFREGKPKAVEKTTANGREKSIELPKDIMNAGIISQIPKDMMAEANAPEISAPILWKRISDRPASALDDLKACNPDYPKDSKWQTNCQRCVPTYEMRRRGYDVKAKPADPNNLYLNQHPYSVWKKPDVICCKTGNGKSEIEATMAQWGDNARAQVVLVWKGSNVGHTFIAEQRNGKTVYIDPQVGKEYVDGYFDRAEPGKTSFCRIDDLTPTLLIYDCCEECE